ncbi:MAG: CpaF family protein [Actinomycetota bacterium]
MSSLAERLSARVAVDQEQKATPGPTPPAPTEHRVREAEQPDVAPHAPQLSVQANARAPEPQPQQSDGLARVKQRAAQALFARIGARLNDPNLSEAQLHALVRVELNSVVEAEQAPLTGEERQRLINEVRDDVLGLGPLQRLIEDQTVTEIMVNGPENVYIEQGGKLTRAHVRFTSEDQLRRIIERIVTRMGRRIDESSPMVDARLEDGSRVNAVIPPLAFSGSTLTIRKFAKDPFKVPDLIRFGTLTPQMAKLLKACVEGKLNVIVSGGTGTGKTTLLNVLSSFIPSHDRIITIEDAVELQLQQDHVVRLESRPSNIEGKGEVTIRDLVRNSLRMRPDRIVVGEVRGGETLDMLQAMNTGHDGSLSTVHANSPRDAIARLETLVLMAGMELPLRAIREQIASAVDLIVQLERLRDGSRRVTAVTEVVGMEGQIVTLQDVYVFDYAAGQDATGRFLGVPIATGVRPKFVERLADHGIELPHGMFDLPPQR